MMKTLTASLATVSLLGLTTSALAQDMAHKYEVTLTNTMDEELIAPVLVVGTAHDDAIFTGNYVTAEAEIQVLTGDPAKLAAVIGKDETTVAHGMDGPPEILLAPGKSLTFTVSTAAQEIRVFAMVAPTKVPDNYLTATIALTKPMAEDMAQAGMVKPMKAAMGSDMGDSHVMIPEGGSLRVGDSGERVALLRKRLGVMEDGDDMRFDETVRSSVMHYQMEHGLNADGVVGPATLASLNGKDMMAGETMSGEAMAGKPMDDASMSGGEAMMDEEALTATLGRFDIGHDEQTMSISPVAGVYGTVSVRKL